MSSLRVNSLQQKQEAPSLTDNCNKAEQIPRQRSCFVRANAAQSVGRLTRLHQEPDVSANTSVTHTHKPTVVTHLHIKHEYLSFRSSTGFKSNFLVYVQAVEMHTKLITTCRLWISSSSSSFLSFAFANFEDV